MTFLIFSIIQKISTVYSILKSGFPLKTCTKNAKSNMKLLSNIIPNQDRLGVHHTYSRFEFIDFLLVAFFFEGFFGFGFAFSLPLHTDFLLCFRIHLPLLLFRAAFLYEVIRTSSTCIP